MWLVAPQTIAMIPVALLQHANLCLPQGVDRALRWVIATPLLHRIHHSPIAAENNSDFGEIFSFWDRLFGTLRESSQEKSVKYGLSNLREESYQTVAGMPATPLLARRLHSL